MRNHRLNFALIPLCTMLWAGCSSECPEARAVLASTAAPASEPASAPTASPPREAESGGVIRQTLSGLPPSPTNAIATRSAGDGVEADLTRIAVTGDLLTIEVRFRNMTQEWQHLSIDVTKVSYIDDATSRRYSVVKDLSDEWMASGMTGIYMGVHIKPGSFADAWFKFPAPPPEMKSFSLLIPNVSPYDGIPMPR